MFFQTSYNKPALETFLKLYDSIWLPLKHLRFNQITPDSLTITNRASNVF